MWVQGSQRDTCVDGENDARGLARCSQPARVAMKTVVRRMQGLFAAAALLTLVGCVGCHKADAQPSNAPPPNPVVKLESPTTAADGATLRLFGRFSFAPGASYAVRAPLSGHVKSVPVTVGQVVEKG